MTEIERGRPWETVRVEYLRSGILVVDGKQYEIVIKNDGTFKDVHNTERRCVADPVGLLTEWSWTEGPKVEYRRVRKFGGTE